VRATFYLIKFFYLNLPSLHFTDFRFWPVFSN